jgi:hypothetical protein
MNAVFKVYKAGQQIFSFDFPIDAELPFSECGKAAFDKFEESFPNVSLFDDDVELVLGRA